VKQINYNLSRFSFSFQEPLFLGCIEPLHYLPNILIDLDKILYMYHDTSTAM